ncbi:MAG: AAA family ATPase [Deltaproteobacteria bacterium]|nr:AAA family ATPase [Deltaproteobacteria bacterium]
MPLEIKLALSISDKDLARQLLQILGETESVRVIESTGPSAGTQPNVALLEDQPSRRVDTLRAIAELRERAPELQIVVLSRDARPEHIVDIMKAGAAEFLLLPLESQRLRDALEKLRFTLLAGSRPTRGAIYSFMGSKGGVGSTVLAVNAAVALALRASSKTVLIDSSLQSGDSSVLLDLAIQTTIADLSKNFHRLDAALFRGAVTQHSTGLDVLPAPASPEESALVEGEHVDRILQLARSLYDHVVVDCSSMTVDARAMEAFRASDQIFIVIELSVPAIRNAARLIRLIGKEAVATGLVEVVVNRFIRGAVPSVQEVEKTLGRRVSWLFPNDYKSIVTSINQGVPVAKGQPGSAFGKNVQEFVAMLQRHDQTSAYRGARGLLGSAI